MTEEQAELYAAVASGDFWRLAPEAQIGRAPLPVPPWWPVEGPWAGPVPEVLALLEAGLTAMAERSRTVEEPDQDADSTP